MKKSKSSLNKINKYWNLSNYHLFIYTEVIERSHGNILSAACVYIIYMYLQTYNIELDKVFIKYFKDL